MELTKLHPSFISSSSEILGSESQDFFEALNDVPPVSIRINPWKTIETQGLERVSWNQYGFYLPTRPAFVEDPSFFQGRYYVQEASSMIIGKVAALLDKKSTVKRALDLCSAPGGKSTDLISSLKEMEILVSNEIVGKRVNPLKENLIKWGETNSVVTHTNPQAFSSLKQEFDLIVVDAPCSGEGMFRKDRKALEQWSSGLVEKCTGIQKEILSAIWSCLKPDGYLIYSTCTLNASENEGVIKWLVDQVEAENTELPEMDDLDLFKTSSGKAGITTYRFLPNRIKGEGFAFSVIKKTGTLNPFGVDNKKKRTPQINWKLKRSDQKPVLANKKLEIDNICENGNELISASRDIVNFTNSYSELLNIQYVGRHLGQRSRSGFIPSHDLSMMPSFGFEPSIDLGKDQSLSFLRRHPIPVQDSEEGWRLALYQGLPLSWAKVHKGQLKSHFPQEYRIRKD